MKSRVIDASTLDFIVWEEREKLKRKEVLLCYLPAHSLDPQVVQDGNNSSWAGRSKAVTSTSLFPMELGRINPCSLVPSTIMEL